MKKIFAIFFLTIAASCAISSPPAGSGFLYTEATEVLYYDPYIKPQQKATLCSKNILGIASYGDNGFTALKLYSDIRKISTIERTYSSRFLIYAESCLIVKGE